ncbi:Holliday junction DNA helicase RuvA [Spiroplasma chinense]|uniref:Holliday junction DNA helicase RuvA n=1 Tax=Spiroplasma chinense TaxID=216932 RepID=A0A5B9Y4E5_9MOLU|nr:hypothetical protein [Spiroplasma chinense]QEH61830.1 Holliday junction DNA helicase RuvA [Spiroplasma chinense]
MYYLNAKIIDIKNNHILIECNNIGYSGRLIGEIKDLIVNTSKKFYFYHLLNEYTDQYIFFDNEKTMKISKTLLTIKKFGIKSLCEIFDKFSYEEFIKILENKELSILVNNTKISETMAKQILFTITNKHLNNEYSKKQMDVINSLHNLGYKISDIYKAVSLIDNSLKTDVLLREAIVKLNEIKN